VVDVNTRDDKAAAGDRTEAVSPPFDPSTMQAERRVATDRLLARLKVIEVKQDAQTLRAYACRYVREQEPVILRLLDAGVGTEEILADLAISFQSIPKADLRYAIAQLRDRRRKQLASTPTGFARGAAPIRQGETGDIARPLREASSVPPAGDRRPDESDEDYRLRKALEGPDGERRRFIGED
jgi:hypothetical protein